VVPFYAMHPTARVIAYQPAWQRV